MAGLEVPISVPPEDDFSAMNYARQYPVIRLFADRIWLSYMVVRSLLQEAGIRVKLIPPLYTLHREGRALYPCAIHSGVICSLDSLIQSMLVGQGVRDARSFEVLALAAISRVVEGVREFLLRRCAVCERYEEEVGDLRGVSASSCTIRSGETYSIMLSPLDAPFYSMIIYRLGLELILGGKASECEGMCVMGRVRPASWDAA
ncbi:MAG: hypothetical protein DRJ67_07215, partial [Thermoprotei archaeon]